MCPQMWKWYYVHVPVHLIHLCFCILGVSSLGSPLGHTSVFSNESAREASPGVGGGGGGGGLGRSPVSCIRRDILEIKIL